MKKKAAAPKKLSLADQQLATFRMQAIQVAANLRDAEQVGGHSMISGGGYMRPGKTSEKVIADAEKICAFVLSASR